MKLNPKHLLAGAWLLIAPFASAQITLQDFSAFQNPATTTFVGDWALNGDPISGDAAPRATFSQGAGFYNFAGGSNADTAGAYYFFLSNPGNITGYSLLELSARVLAGNTATSFTVSLFDSLGESAFAVFSTAALAGPGFTTVSNALIFSPSFDKTDLSFMFISGAVLNGASTLNVSFDNIAVTAPRAIVAVPEPSTYGAAAGITLLGLVAARRIRRFLA